MHIEKYNVKIIMLMTSTFCAQWVRQKKAHNLRGVCRSGCVLQIYMFLHYTHKKCCGQYNLYFVAVIVLCGFAVHSFCIFHLNTGIVVGVGATMVRESSAVMLGHYFKRRRQFVEMITMSGEGVGIALFSVILKEGVE